MSRLWCTGCLGVVLLLAGCPGCKTVYPPCQARSLRVITTGSERLNQDDRGRSSPAFVRVYQLKSNARFESSSFQSMWKEDKGSLGEDMLAEPVEITVYPGHETVHNLERKDPNSQLAAMAIFRKPSGISWRTVQILPNDTGMTCPEETPKPDTFNVSFFLEDYRIETRQKP